MAPPKSKSQKPPEQKDEAEKQMRDQRLREILPVREKRPITRMSTPRKAKPFEAKSEFGHDKPALILATEADADLHTKKEYLKIVLLIKKSMEKSALSDMMVTLKRTQPFLLSLSPLLNITKLISDATDSIPAEKFGTIVPEAKSLLTKDFLGETIHKRFTATPPMITLFGNDFHDRYNEAYGGDIRGEYISDTNHILLYKNQGDLDTARSSALHELIHYACWLGGGGDRIRWEAPDGEFLSVGRVLWLDEGLTELFTRLALSSKGYSTGAGCYKYESAVAQALLRIVDQDTLREAYLTGDFSEVMKTVNGKLGDGVFERLLTFPRGAEAAEYLEQKMKSR